MAAVRSLLAEGRLDEASILGADALTAVEVDDEGPALRAVLHVLLAEVVCRTGTLRTLPGQSYACVMACSCTRACDFLCVFLQVLLRQGKLSLADRHAERATLLAPDYPPGWLMRAAAAAAQATKSPSTEPW
jgi:hypothetical protein